VTVQNVIRIREGKTDRRTFWRSGNDLEMSWSAGTTIGLRCTNKQLHCFCNSGLTPAQSSTLLNKSSNLRVSVYIVCVWHCSIYYSYWCVI